MNMIEKVAREIHSEDNSEWPKEGCHLCIRIAKRCISAMREPSEEMLASVDYEAIATSYNVDLIVQYTTMIDAALKE